MTLLQCIQTKFFHNLTLVILILCGYFIADMTYEPPTSNGGNTYKVEPVTKAEALIAKHNCWTTGGKHPIPGHAVVTLRNGRTIYDDAEAALQQAFGNADYGITIHGFCR